MAKDTKAITRIPKPVPEPKNPDAPRPEWDYVIEGGKKKKAHKS